MDEDAATEVAAKRQRFFDAHPHGFGAGELMALPESVPWLPLHQACDPRPDVWYWIDVERIGTLRQVIHWASHLSDKGWITATDWADLLRRIGTDA